MTEHKSIEELKKDFEMQFGAVSLDVPDKRCLILKNKGSSAMDVLENRVVNDEIWNFFLPHLNSRNLLEWATGNDTGVSSVSLLRYMMGFEPNDWGFMAPSDKDDRGRCVRLLKKFPEWLDRLDEMKKFSGWEEQIPLIKDEFLESESKHE